MESYPKMSVQFSEIVLPSGLQGVASTRVGCGSCQSPKSVGRFRSCVGSMPYEKKLFAWFSFALLLAATSLCAPFARAQNSTEDVHIQPRVSTAPKEPDIDPALKTHTKPFKVDVEMVLVP